MSGRKRGEPNLKINGIFECKGQTFVSGFCESWGGVVVIDAHGAHDYEKLFDKHCCRRKHVIQ